MGSVSKLKLITGTARQHTRLVEALCDAGIPPHLADDVLTIVARAVYELLWHTLADARSSSEAFDALTALLQRIDVCDLSARHAVPEDFVATSLVVILPRLLGRHRSSSGSSLSGERLTIRVLGRILQHRFPPA